MIGENISHYRIVEKLGAGGMGEVYLAHDTKLDRKVAIKILPSSIALNEDRMRRFVQEAKAAAALNHPNIAHVYEIGNQDDIHYIAMEYVQGQTLREKIQAQKGNLELLLKSILQVAEGLSKAHAAGIVHRDLKPDNIMITQDGYAKILDFGLAKLIDQTVPSPNGLSEAPTAAALNQSAPGIVLGTVGYMSPEQAQAKPVDQRSDIFSFGCILFEAATGRKAFAGDSVIDILHKIIYEPAPAITETNPNAPSNLQRIVRKCLVKDPDKRYQTIRDTAIDLEEFLEQLKTGARNSEMQIDKTDTGNAHSVSRPTSSAEYIITGIKHHKNLIAFFAAVIVVALAAWFYFKGTKTEVIDSIAVLPFTNTANSSNEYISDGVTESIINNLSQMKELKVMARSTVFRFKGRESDAQTVGKELGVRAVMTGRMIQQGENLTISVELMNVDEGTQLWGKHYNRPSADLAVLQQEISRDISEQLRPVFSGEVRQLNKGGTTDTEAYRLYLLGRFQSNKRSREGINKAISQFQQAIDRDPNYALAYVGLADSYTLLGQYTGMPSSEILPKARAAVDRALQIDPTLAEAYTSSANIHQMRWNWREAEAQYQRAISLNPNYATAHHWYQLLLRGMRRWDEALIEIKRAQDLDPLSPIIAVNVATAYIVKGDYDSAMKEAKKLVDLDPNFTLAYEPLGSVYVLLKKYPEAIEAFEKGVAIDRTAYSLSHLGYAYGLAGKHDEARAILKEVEQLYSRNEALSQYVALIYLGLGDLEQTFAWLEKDFQTRSGYVEQIASNKFYDPIRKDPRFIDLERRLGLLNQ